MLFRLSLLSASIASVLAIGGNCPASFTPTTVAATSTSTSTSSAASSTSIFSAGCGIAGYSSKIDSNGHLTVTNVNNRQYLIHVPPNYNSAIAHPLVFSFHGYNGASATQETLTQLSYKGLQINNTDIIAVYPLGGLTLRNGAYGTAWQGAPYANASFDDIQFTKDMVADLTTNLCVDTTRIYATGKSNGGGFVNLLMCTPSAASLFAAFAPISPALYPNTGGFFGNSGFATCNTTKVINFINSHGYNDTVIPYYGRADVNGDTTQATVNVDSYRQYWAVRNGCAAPGAYTSSTNPYVNATEYAWNCSPQLAFSVNNLGHSWPTVLGLDASGSPLQFATWNITNPDIVTFFSQYHL